MAITCYKPVEKLVRNAAGNVSFVVERRGRECRESAPYFIPKDMVILFT